MAEPGFDLKRDGLGIGLFALGAFFAVLAVVALWKGGDLAQAQGSGVLARAALGTIGLVPALLVSAGIAALGARAWLGGETDGLARNVLTLAGCALAVSVLLGAFSETAGGRLGDSTGGLLADSAHPVAGAALGVLALAGAVWFGWLRPARTELDQRTEVQNPDAREAAPPDDGVSAAEAAALTPDPGDLALAELALRKQQAVKSAPPPSPYPEDVRLRGEIPAGARPLDAPRHEPRHEPQAFVEPPPAGPARTDASPAVLRWTAPRGEPAAVPAGEDLAPAPAAEVVFDARPEPEPPPEPAGTELRALAAEAAREVDVQPLAPLPAPSWEQSDLFRDEEPVDAYGTPLTLVEELRRSQREVAEAFEEESTLGLAGEREDVAEPPAIVVAARVEERRVAGELELEAQGELDEEGSGDLEEELDDDLEDEELDEEAELEEDGDEEDGDEEELDEDDLDEEDPAEGELEGEDLEDEAELDEEDSEDLEEAAQEHAGTHADAGRRAPVSELFAEEEPMAPLASRGEPAPSAKETAAAPVRVAAARPAAVQREILPFAAPARPDPAPAASVERDVVLQPPAQPAERTVKPAAGDTRSKLVAEAGLLFLERGRVAVSMLQRQYGMDFDEACRVLDELQELGLIGPYLGGQSRDILLSRDQWLEKVGGG